MVVWIPDHYAICHMPVILNTKLVHYLDHHCTLKSSYQRFFAAEYVTCRRFIFDDNMWRCQSDATLWSVEEKSFRIAQIRWSANAYHVVERSKVVYFLFLLLGQWIGTFRLWVFCFVNFIFLEVSTAASGILCSFSYSWVYFNHM